MQSQGKGLEDQKYKEATDQRFNTFNIVYKWNPKLIKRKTTLQLKSVHSILTNGKMQ